MQSIFINMQIETWWKTAPQSCSEPSKAADPWFLPHLASVVSILWSRNKQSECFLPFLLRKDQTQTPLTASYPWHRISLQRRNQSSNMTGEAAPSEGVSAWLNWTSLLQAKERLWACEVDYLPFLHQHCVVDSLMSLCSYKYFSECVLDRGFRKLKKVDWDGFHTWLMQNLPSKSWAS